MTIIIEDTGKVMQITRIGELVQIYYFSGLELEPIEHEIRADEASSAGDQNCVFHTKSLSQIVTSSVLRLNQPVPPDGSATGVKPLRWMASARGFQPTELPSGSLVQPL